MSEGNEVKSNGNNTIESVSQALISFIDVQEKAHDNILTVLNAMESRLQEVENIRAPQNIYGKIASVFQTMDDLDTKITGLVIKVDSYFKGETATIEEFTNEQIKGFYVNSEITTQEAKAFIEKTLFEGKEVSPATISRYVNGNIEDLKSRSILGKWLRAKCAEKISK